MDIVSSTKTPAKPRSSRSRHGSIKGGSARRPPSPDSACEHDSEWVNGVISGTEEATSDMSEESEKTRKCSGRKASMRESSASKRKSGDATLSKGVAGQDSDVDSGIVACRKPGQRIGSTSSADTDSSQESRRRIEYSPPIQKVELTKSRSSCGSLRVPKHISCLSQSGGPVKGDHAALKECNRRPPTPLSVFPDSHHCVRFDEQLQLSEQNIRRSCRKLFATLYAQRFSYPSHPDSALLHGRCSGGSTRIRSKTVPELDLRRYSPVSVDGQSRHSRTFKENVGPVEGRRSGSLAWSRGVLKSPSDACSKALPSPQVQRHRLQIHPKFPMDLNESTTSCTTSTDSGLGSYRSNSQCTCQNRQPEVCLCSSQSTSSPQCTCRCCSCPQQLPRTQERTFGLFKSSSCSTLSSVLSHQSRPHLTQFPPRASRKSFSNTENDVKESPYPLQKTPSCSNILDRTSSFQMSNVPVYSDNMYHVYAHVVSVVPDETKSSSQGGRRAKTLSRIRYNSENEYDSIRPSSNATFVSLKSDASRSTKSTESNSGSYNLLSAELSKDLESLKDAYESTKVSNDKSVSEDAKSTHSQDIYSQISDGSLSRASLRESMQTKMHSSQRPKSVGIVAPSCGPNPIYLKSALKKPTHAALQQVNDMPSELQNGVSHLAEAEYAVVDKSKKNRFASLPALNGGNANSSAAQDADEKDPPIPPKKLLHKSDFSLYRSRSSSPKKSFLGRMQTLTRNAKSAIQKAFSTERIYRPEREERLEAHKDFQRSKSFIRNLTGSFRKKKRKNKTPMAEVVPQASSNPEWDEQPTGPNSPIHVRGQLLQLNLDGSQVVELTKPPTKPYGFFVARGRVRNSKGVFVSRMRDQETQKQLAGLLDIGDEILEIDGSNVKDADIMEVNRLMANKNTLLLTVLPYICRKDI